MAFAYRCIVLHYLLLGNFPSAQPFKRTKELNLASPTRRKFKKKKHNLPLSLPSIQSYYRSSHLSLLSAHSAVASTNNQSLSLINLSNISTSSLRLYLFLFLLFLLSISSTSIFCFRFAKNAFSMSSLMKPPSPSPHLLGFPATGSGLQRGSTATSSDYVIFYKF